MPNKIVVVFYVKILEHQTVEDKSIASIMANNDIFDHRDTDINGDRTMGIFFKVFYSWV